MHLLSQRLRLRPWQDADRAPFAALSADPEIMRYLMPLATRTESDAWIDRQIAHQAQHGFCFWAVETRDDGEFVGAVGLSGIRYDAHFTPAIQAGWRIARRFWRQGYASEAAAAALRFGFEELRLQQIVANTSVHNAASQRVMGKLGMTRNPADDYDHPRVPEGHSLRRQVLYRTTSK